MFLSLLDNITDPTIVIELTANNPVLYQPLTLQCNAIIMGAITSTVDFIWTTGNTQVRRTNSVTATIAMNSLSVYIDLFIIPSLSISDNGSVYHCEVLINSSLPAAASSNITIFIPGTFVQKSSVNAEY